MGKQPVTVVGQYWQCQSVEIYLVVAVRALTACQHDG